MQHQTPFAMPAHEFLVAVLLLLAAVVAVVGSAAAPPAAPLLLQLRQLHRLTDARLANLILNKGQRPGNGI